jgi:hypothetical protein
MQSLKGQISLRQMMIIVALMTLISSIAVSCLQFNDAYWKVIVEPLAPAPARPLRRPVRPLVPPPPYLVQSVALFVARTAPHWDA